MRPARLSEHLLDVDANPAPQPSSVYVPGVWSAVERFKSKLLRAYEDVAVYESADENFDGFRQYAVTCSRTSPANLPESLDLTHWKSDVSRWICGRAKSCGLEVDESSISVHGLARGDVRIEFIGRPALFPVKESELDDEDDPSAFITDYLNACDWPIRMRDAIQSEASWCDVAVLTFPRSDSSCCVKFAMNRLPNSKHNAEVVRVLASIVPEFFPLTEIAVYKKTERYEGDDDEKIYSIPVRVNKANAVALDRRYGTPVLVYTPQS